MASDPVDLDPVFGVLSNAALLAGWAIIIGVIVLWRLPAVRATYHDRFVRVRPWTIWAAWLVACVCMAGSLYYSEVRDFAPCRHCWEQRIAMYPLTAILLVGAWRQDRHAAWYAGPSLLVGWWLAINHYRIMVWPPEVDTCGGSVSCTDPYVGWGWRLLEVDGQAWGFVTIPWMSMAGFTFIAALMLLWVVLPGEETTAVVTASEDDE